MRGCLGVLLGLALVSATGCGEEDRRVAGTPDPDHAREVARNPYVLTCGDLARQPEHPESQKLVIRAEFALAREPALERRVAAMTENRTGRSVYYALSEICKGRDPSFRPARMAVQAVRRGDYLVPVRPDDGENPSSAR